MKQIYYLTVLIIISAQILFAQNKKLNTSFTSSNIDNVDLGEFFDSGIEGCFVLLDTDSKKMSVYNYERVQKGFIPASTFKIPNSLIALETGAAEDENFVINWDSVKSPPSKFWPDNWRKDQTLKSAFQNSVYWYYQEIARRIGEERMRNYLEKFNYGNQDIGGGLDKFWLYGDIRISPLEQVDFLKRFYFNEFGLTDRTIDIVKDIMILEKTSDYILGGKTGTAEITETRELGWLVGYVETGDKVYTYALNMEGETVWEEWPPQKRSKLVHDILIRLKIIPEE